MPIFYTQKFLPRTIFTNQKLFRTEAFTVFFLTIDSNYRQMIFTQQILRTEILHTEGFLCIFFSRQTFNPQIALHGKGIAHRNLCTQHILLLYREVLLPLLDHLFFVFPLSNIWFAISFNTRSGPYLGTM